MKYVLVLLAASVFAQSIDSPRVGTVLGNDGVLRVLHGIAGNFTLGEEVPSDAEPPSLYTVEHRENGVFIVNAQGGVVDALPPSTGAVLLLHDAIVYVAENELVLRRADRSETRYTLSGITLLRRMSDDYVQAGTHALRLSTGQLYLLPQAGPQGRRR